MPGPFLRKRLVFNFVLVLGGLSAAFVGGGWVAAHGQQAPTSPATYQPENPAYRGLDANLYMQTAAEYRACCLQAYNLATLRLKAALAKQPVGPAVILDLDETVLDNAGFQAMQCRSKLAYDQRLWDQWELQDGARVALIPGAKEFILEAREQGVSIAYITNRNERSREQCLQTLTRLGIAPTKYDFLKMSSDTSDKTKRRKEVEAERNVLLLVGDNLRDFDEKFKFGPFDKSKPAELDQAIRQRKEAVEKDRAIWGDRWIILPNPAYGEWTKPLGLGEKDLDRLAPVITGKHG